MGVLYVLDEPSIGLHQRDNRKLIETLRTLRDLGNTLIVVEHDEDMIRSADHVIDMGPGAGLHGGAMVAEGTPAADREEQKIPNRPVPHRGKKDRYSGKTPQSEKFITVKGCRENNLKNIDAKFPIGLLTVITGVSGSGKSTLVYETLYKGMMQILNQSRDQAGRHDGSSSMPRSTRLS